MTRTALLTGSKDRLSVVAPAMHRAGFEVIEVDNLDDLDQRCKDLGPDSLDAYVQLPIEVPSSEGPLVERVRSFLASGLLRRFEAASAVLPCLKPGSVVVFAAGQRPGFEGAPDDRHARLELLRVLARAVLAELRDRDVRTVILGDRRTPDAIADATRRRTAMSSDTVGFAGEEPELTYDDWARELLALTDGD
ncbi:MAG: hypothetical protein ACRDV9_10055 [Acidimicrobiia bacterium]